MKNVKIEIPQNVVEIGQRLENAGYEAYVVGGCVRDAVLGKTPHDWDITTNAPTETIRSIFSGKDAATLNIAGALEHGVCFVLYGGEQYEIATFRKDGDYLDGRHCTVETGVPLYEDLKRRDFTINAMAIRIVTNEFVDLFNGIEDCENKVLRAVGNAHDRLNEDALRILRAFRFAAQLGFELDESLFDAIATYKERIPLVSAERREKEITKIFCSGDCKRMMLLMRDMGVLDIILPEFIEVLDCEQNNPHHKYSVGVHSLVCMENVPNKPELRWAAFLHDFGKVDTKKVGSDGYDHFASHPAFSVTRARKILANFKFDNEFIKKVCVLIENHDNDFVSKSSIRRFYANYGEELLRDVIVLREADTLAQSDFCFEEKMKKIVTARNLIDEVIANEQAFSLKDLAVNGKDLIDLGYKPGPIFSQILNELYSMVLQDMSLNDRDFLLSKIKEM